MTWVSKAVSRNSQLCKYDNMLCSSAVFFSQRERDTMRFMLFYSIALVLIEMEMTIEQFLQQVNIRITNARICNVENCVFFQLIVNCNMHQNQSISLISWNIGALVIMTSQKIHFVLLCPNLKLMGFSVFIQSDKVQTMKLRWKYSDN